MDSNGNLGGDEQLYLGLDLSTQQLKAVAINGALEVRHEAAVHFDSDLPEFRTSGGVQRHDDKRTVTAQPLMWVKAVDLVLEKLKLTGLDFAQVAAISGSGQQHGSVYWRRGARDVLKSLNPDKFLHSQLDGLFAARDSPVWMDSSTGEECRAMEAAVGGPQALAALTGSRGYERFTGSQIKKMRERRPEVYAQTERIALVSSFAASIFRGDYAPVDLADGSGMNLLNIETRRWDERLLQVCGGGDGDDLLEKLGEQPVPSHTVLGPVSPYFVHRYGFLSNCQVVAFTGDNPASLVGMALRPGDVAISLGTSDTAFLVLAEPKPNLHGHILCNPVDESIYMALICFKNGSFTRERISRDCAEGDWTLFSELLDSTPRGNFGNIGFYFDFEEIYPVISGDFRYNKFDARINRFSKEVEVRACIEGQFLRLRAHAEALGYRIGPDTRILATGGASANKSLLQTLADVFNAPVFVQDRPNSAALGAALMARYALCKDTVGSFDELVRSGTNDFRPVAEPSKDSPGIYVPMVQRYRKLEEGIAHS